MNKSNLYKIRLLSSSSYFTYLDIDFTDKFPNLTWFYLLHLKIINKLIHETVHYIKAMTII